METSEELAAELLSTLKAEHEASGVAPDPSPLDEAEAKIIGLETSYTALKAENEKLRSILVELAGADYVKNRLGE